MNASVTEEQVRSLVFQVVGARAGLSIRAVATLVESAHDRLFEDLGLPAPNIKGLTNDLSFISQGRFKGLPVMPSDMQSVRTVRQCITLTLKRARSQRS